MENKENISSSITNHDHSVEGDVGECQFCTNRFVFLSFNVIHPHVKYFDDVLFFSQVLFI
jgi:hypothetical protein